ncbi:hypothetical protein ONE63_008858 [Megalurothrips usitatus]|uniref:MAM domain-containing protein n=1 Tax=Megalurothrips usitatus TaxID=439358 RepID=A0AAV7XHQ1_9NEOP|nr:hypothetical protein ONE63_008858 [Megalurothrips usitatus]
MEDGPAPEVVASSTTTAAASLVAASTAPTTPLAPDVVPLTGTPTEEDGDAEQPEHPAGTTVVSVSSTKIDATTVVLFSSTFASTAAPAEPAATTPAADEGRVTTEETVEMASSPRPTVDTGWRTTSATPRIPTAPPRPTMPPVKDNDTAASASCDFGLYPTTTLCGWRPLHAGRAPASPRWRPGSGVATNWVGGPRADSDGEAADAAVAAAKSKEPAPSGGYAFVETSEGAGAEGSADRAFLMSPQLAASGPQGSCFFFMYSLAGLSARGLRVLLARNESARLRLRELWFTTPPHVPGDGWLHAQLLYSEPQPHRLILEASTTPVADPSRAYRGHVAVDAVALVPGEACPAPLACTFAAGLCRWTNARQGDDFDWHMGRGSAVTFTGPAAPADSWQEPQHGSLPKQQLQHEGRGLGDDVDDIIAADLEDAVVEAETEHRPHPGGYVYIDSSYPRRPGDTARLESELLPPSDPLFPNCLRFWFHMFGVDVGSLRLLLVSESGRERTAWALTGDAGNAWFRGAVTLAEPQPFRVVIEASVGAVAMSDIAVDNVSLDPGPCPVSPQVAGAPPPPPTPHAPAPRAPRMPPDCSMEVDECGWRGAPGQASQWSRLPVVTLPPTMQRRPQGPGDDSHGGAGLRNDYFLGLQMPPSLSGSSPSPATTLISLPITSKDEPLCLAFWYLVHEPSPAGAMSTGLGALRVVVKEVPDVRRDQGQPQAADDAAPQSATVWALYNTQGPAWRPARVPLPANFTFVVELEGEWGPGKHAGILAVDDIVLYHAKCPGMPSSALSSPADCSFSTDTCSWSNRTATTGRAPGWQHANGHHRPARLSDNTFRAPGGYVFFDMFSLSKLLRRARLQSPTLDAGDPVCLSFWFAAFGQGDSTVLRVVRVDQDRRLPEITVWRLDARGLDTARPQWMSAQATVAADSAFAVVLEGEASNGGFAVDDVRVRPGSCPTRPANARLG